MVKAKSPWFPSLTPWSKRILAKNPWFWYRLGDMVRSKEMRDMECGKKLHYKLYPDSLASQYMREANKSNDFNLLINIVKKHPLDLKPEKDEVAVHLRVGDIIDDSEYTVKELLEKRRPFSNGNFYVKPLSFYEKHLTQIQAKKIVIVAGGCKAQDFTKSKVYIEKIKTLFEESGFNVRTRLGYSPDDDFVYMCRSNLFIQSGGGFSWLVKCCRFN